MREGENHFMGKIVPKQSLEFTYSISGLLFWDAKTLLKVAYRQIECHLKHRIATKTTLIKQHTKMQEKYLLIKTA